MYQSIERTFNKKAPLAEIIEMKKSMNGPVLVVAGAGSGKTTVLTTRVGFMVHEKQIDPASILLVTFTKKASTEMID